MQFLPLLSEMAAQDLLASNLGSITGSSSSSKMGGGGPCGPGVISGMSILRFGKSLPLIELFETFMIAGVVLVAVASAAFFTFHHIAEILKSEGGSPASVNLANAAAHSQPVWIAVGIVIFFIGVVLYYLHRRIISSPS